MREQRLGAFRHPGCWVAEPGQESAGSAWFPTPFFLPIECGCWLVLRGGWVWSWGPGQWEGRKNGLSMDPSIRKGPGVGSISRVEDLKTARLLCMRADGQEVRLEECLEPLSEGSHLPSAVSVFPIPAHPRFLTLPRVWRVFSNVVTDTEVPKSSHSITRRSFRKHLLWGFPWWSSG